MIKKKSIIFVILALITATAFSGCGKVIQEIDKNKTQIYVSVFDGGFGADWLQAAATEFNGQNEKYEVVLKQNKDDLSAVYYMLNNGTNTAQVYFAQESIYVKQLIINDKLEDLTDVYASKPDGENGKTVKEKINNVSVYESAYSVKGNSGIYALPHLQNLWGLYYDNNMFIENNWAFFAEATDEGDLTSQGIAFEKSGKYYIFKSSTGKTNYKAGDKLLSRGKDGVFGTYDDGQPRSLAELETLLNKVSITNGSKGFIWTGKLLDYTKGMLESLLGQYDGADAVKLFYDYEGTYKGESITTADGHKVWGMDGLAKGINFQKDYMMDGKYVHPASVLTGTSHVDAQNLYLYGYEKTKDNPQAAYILEGNWWEREARGTMDSIAQEGYPEKAYGKGDYRILLWPEMSGQKGIDGTGKGTVYAVNDSGAIYVAKNADS